LVGQVWEAHSGFSVCARFKRKRIAVFGVVRDSSDEPGL
jgi:hypothetical protein